MTPSLALFLTLSSILLIGLPRRRAFVVILFCALYTTLVPVVEIGQVSFTPIRLLLIVGGLRCIYKRETIERGFVGLDWIVLMWGFWNLLSSAGHWDPGKTLVYRAGLVADTCGLYFLTRVFCQSEEELVSLLKALALMLVPLAIEMIYEVMTGKNIFSALGGVPEASTVREGRVRAQGPFQHAILAGTVGAVILPLMLTIRKRHRVFALVGCLACLVMVVASRSTGPILSAMSGIFALYMWCFRYRMRSIRWLALLGYLLLELVMKAPAYYLMARIDLTGGSTGWHRAELIRSSIVHLREWLFWGADYTRHWMPTGVSWSAQHTDITNYYLKMGVLGGLPLMTLFIAQLWKGFQYVGRIVRYSANLDTPPKSPTVVWGLGSSLFAVAATSMSVSFFDQSVSVVNFLLAATAALWSQARFISTKFPNSKRFTTPSTL